MPWGLWASPAPPAPSASTRPNPPPTPRPEAVAVAAHERNSSSSGDSFFSTSKITDSGSSLPKGQSTGNWDGAPSAINWSAYAEPRNWVPTALATAAILGIFQFYRSYLRRIPGTGHVPPNAFRQRVLLGKVTSVGDGDNFHLFHIPGGRLAGWGWARRVPVGRKLLKGTTIPIRIAGIDAPEGAHFGRPAQPYSAEALAFLQSYILGKRVRAHIYKKDHYERVVATVWVRKPPFFFPARDVGLEMLRRGFATTYEAKTGAEFGGAAAEKKYREAEVDAKRKRRGLWAGVKGKGVASFFKKAADIESPRDYKTRWAQIEKEGVDKPKSIEKTKPGK